MSEKYVVIIFLTWVLLGFPIPVASEIGVPYIVDEKERVLFSDSEIIVATTTYKGLENYTSDYIGGYLHYAFTYTHDDCCFSGHPPSIYITDKDPRGTTTIQVRFSYPVYQLSSRPTHLTGLYYYDVQFDHYGYHAFVEKDGGEVIADFRMAVPDLSGNDWVALANRNPMLSLSGGIRSDSSMAFTPQPLREPELTIATRTPVVIIPGIMGTEFFEDNIVDDLIWPNVLLLAASITDDFLDILKMDQNGSSISKNIKTGEIVKSLNKSDYFEGLLNELLKEGYVDNNSYFENPYDWRIDIGIAANNLNKKIIEIKNVSGVEKVNLISHSMGGLLAKEYLRKYGGDSIDKFVNIGTPHMGSPSAYKILMHGDDLGVNKLFNLVGINSERIKDITQNMPSVYQLLPSRKYLENKMDYYVFDGVDKNGRLSFEQTRKYLGEKGRNRILIDRADSFHQETGDLDPAYLGVNAYNFVGCGVPTIGKFYILDKREGHYQYNIQMINGDGTVPLRSAEAMPAQQTFYINSAKHALLPSAIGVKELIAEILISTSTTLFNVTFHPNIALTPDGCNIPDGKLVSFHSPINLHVYDDIGNHVGPNEDGDIENNIGGVVYEIIDGNKFAYLPDGINYEIRGVATAGGAFDTYIQEIIDGEVISTTLFTNVSLGPDTRVSFNISSQIPDEINLDHNADGEIDSRKKVSTTTIGILESIAIQNPPQTLFSNNERVGSSKATPYLMAEILEVNASSSAITTVMHEKAFDSPVFTSAARVIEESSSPEPVEKGQTTIEGDGIENAAVAYKSIGLTLKEKLKALWAWIKSKI